jgi:hypothetical protein
VQEIHCRCPGWNRIIHLRESVPILEVYLEESVIIAVGIGAPGYICGCAQVVYMYWRKHIACGLSSKASSPQFVDSSVCAVKGERWLIVCVVLRDCCWIRLSCVGCGG